MNKELEKLVDYALVDGYISEKEKEVLIKKAKQQGFDVDELEMILEGKQYERTVESAPKVDKCPNCGEILNGLSNVCPSCDYIINAKSKKKGDSLDVALDKLNDHVLKLDYVPEPGVGRAIKVAILSVLSAGIYLILRKLLWKYIFDKKYDDYKNIHTDIDARIQKIRLKYGDDRKTGETLDTIKAQVIEKADKRSKKTAIIGTITFALIGLAYFGIWRWSKMPSAPKVESAVDRTERLINSDSIGKAKIAAGNIEKVSTREYYIEKIMLKEIDSLVKIKDYNAAILLTSKLDEGGYAETRKKKLDSVVSLEVRELVDNKDFKKAKERTELTSYITRSDLEEMIKLSETIDKDNRKKHKK